MNVFDTDKLMENPDCKEAPIFIFGCCWRSGSTLLQRLCASEGLIWGEPYESTYLWEHLCAPLHFLADSWPPPHYIYQQQSLEWLSKNNTANLFPRVEFLEQAYRTFTKQLLQVPAAQLGDRWGAKFVRSNSDLAAMLRWIYPCCKIVFLLRNPYDCLTSWSRWTGSVGTVYDRPDLPISATRLAEVWQRNTQSFLADNEKSNSLVVRYESLIQGDFQALESYLELKLSRSAMQHRLTDNVPDNALAKLSNQEESAFQRIVEPLAADLGYFNAFVSVQLKTDRTASNVVPPSKVAILVPVGNYIEPACEAGLRGLENAGYSVRRVRGFSAIDQARNSICAGALRDGFEELIWIDSDIGFSPDDVERLRSHNQPICCGIYPKKGRRELACHVMPGQDSVLFGADGGLVEIKYCGAGFLLVKRQVFERLQTDLNLPLCNEHFGEPIVPFFQPMVLEDPGKRWYLAEDYAFCERARLCGYRIMADTSIRLKHIGSYEYSWEDAGLYFDRFATFRFNLH